MQTRKQVGWVLILWGSFAIAAPEKPKTPVVYVQKLIAAQLFDVLSYPARLIPKINATILSDLDGIVSRISTPLGSTVTKNQKILVLEHTDPVYHYAPTVVTAPVKGIVSSVEVTEGSRVMRGQRLASITDPMQLTIVVEVAVSDLSSIHQGMPGDLQLSGQEARIPVIVRGVSPFVDPATGTATCEMALASPAEAKMLPAGFVGQVTFKAREHKGIQVPEHAVVYRGKDPFVRIVDGGKAKFLAVTLGDSRQGNVEITKGLDEGAQIVLRSSAFLSDGEAVDLQAVGAE